jgi:hypothetical protein
MPIQSAQRDGSQFTLPRLPWFRHPNRSIFLYRHLRHVVSFLSRRFPDCSYALCCAWRSPLPQLWSPEWDPFLCHDCLYGYQEIKRNTLLATCIRTDGAQYNDRWIACHKLVAAPSAAPVRTYCLGCTMVARINRCCSESACARLNMWMVYARRKAVCLFQTY